VKPLINVSGIESNFEVQLPVHYSVYQYIAGIDPKEYWTLRGTGGYSLKEQSDIDGQTWTDKRDNYLNRTIEESRRTINNDQSLTREFREFLRECNELTQALYQDDRSVIRKYVAGKTFHFVLGYSRTGGTYLMREMSKALNWPYKQFLFSMVHDHMPDFNLMMGAPDDEGVRELFNTGWRHPQRHLQILFQLAQLLVYLKREAGDYDQIVKKIFFSHCLQLADEIFGDHANYYVTIRHPGATRRSWADLKEEENLTDREKRKTLKNWESLYRNAVRDGLPEGEFVPVLFGPGMDEFLEAFYDNHSPDTTPEKCRVKDRNYGDYWNSEPVRETIDRVGRAWSLVGADFPEPVPIR